MIRTQYGRPLIVNDLVGSVARSLDRIQLQKSGDGQFNECWLQALISRHPNLLPIDQIEPALTPAISVCMELPVQSGYVDNLYVTPTGDLIVGETKLYRNPEARREVIGQIFDYAKDLSALSYEQLNAAIANANAPDGPRTVHPVFRAGVWRVVSDRAARGLLSESRLEDWQIKCRPV